MLSRDAAPDSAIHDLERQITVWEAGFKDRHENAVVDDPELRHLEGIKVWGLEIGGHDDPAPIPAAPETDVMLGAVFSEMASRLTGPPEASLLDLVVDRPADPERKALFVLARFERWALPRLAAALPRWVVPDHMTALGILAATWTAVAYDLSNRDQVWLWGASLGLVVHWFGDSLDGTLARVRHIERPRFGFYLDHLTDAYSTTAIGVGLGLSPYMLLSVALTIVIAYLVLSINVYLETQVFGEFRFGYGIVGPTEARLLLIGLNTLALFRPPLPFHVGVVGATVFDVIGSLGAATMIALLASRVWRNLRALARFEPPRS